MDQRFTVDSFDSDILAVQNGFKFMGAKDASFIGTTSPNANYSERFVLAIGKQCRVMAIKDIARLMRLGWNAVKDIGKVYMREQLQRTEAPKPRVIGIDEISIKKRLSIGVQGLRTPLLESQYRKKREFSPRHIRQQIYCPKGFRQTSAIHGA